MSPTIESSCVSCRTALTESSKYVKICGICQEHVCKSCFQFLEESTFSFLPVTPEELKHSYYCSHCYDQQVVPALESYKENLERARGVFFFFDSQKKPMQPLRTSRKVVHVDECADRDETILRLAFAAVVQGYNSVIDANVSAKKVQNAGYQKSVWNGSGIPVDLDVEKLNRIDEQRW